MNAAGERDDLERPFRSTDWSPTSGDVLRSQKQVEAAIPVAAFSEQLYSNGWKAIAGGELAQRPLLMTESRQSVDLQPSPTRILVPAPHSEALTQSEPPSKRLTLKEIKTRSHRKRLPSLRGDQETASSDENASVGGAVNLKTILKQSSRVSLSEILQQQNLSLEDLLKGKGSALKALISTAATPDSEEKRPPKAVSHRTPNRNQAPGRKFTGKVKRPENVDQKESEEEKYVAQSAQNRVVSTIPTFLSSPSPGGTGTGVRHLSPHRSKLIKEVVPNIRPDLNNSNVKRRLPNLKFKQNAAKSTESAPNQTAAESVSSNSTDGETKANEEKPLKTVSLEIGLNVTEDATAQPPEDPANVEADETTPPYIVITLSPPVRPSTTSSSVAQNALNDKFNSSLPETNTILHKNGPPNLRDLFMADSVSDERESQSASIDKKFIYTSVSDSSESGVERPSSQKMFAGDFVNVIRKKIGKLDVTERIPSLITDVTAVYFDDRLELLDLMGDRRGGSRLLKVLKQRNMTLDELIDHRKRGSSQLHLAEIFHGRTSRASTQAPPETKPTAATRTKTGRLNIVTAFKTFPEFNLDSVKSVDPDDIKTDSQGSSYFTSVINVKSPNESRSLRQSYSIELPATNANVSAQQWNSGFSHDARPETGSSQISLDISGRFEKPHSDPAARSHETLGSEVLGHNLKRNSVLIENAQKPIGVRSAIIASTSIVVISLSIFIVIFLVFRYRQRRRRKICYSANIQAIRGRLPILSTDDSLSKQSTSTPSLPYYSSRRCSKLNTMDPNSPEVQEYLYDARRKSFR